MRPGRFVGEFGLIEPPALQQFLVARFNQHRRAFFGPVIDAVVRERHGAFGHTALATEKRAGMENHAPMSP